MRDRKLDEADQELKGLASVNEDLPIDVRINILYERACTQSLKAATLRSGTTRRDAALDISANALVKWYRHGREGGWDAIG
jgi:hypothetical protein